MSAIIRSSFVGDETAKWWARFGSFVLALGHGRTANDLRSDIASQLSKDSRVTRVSPGAPGEQWDEDHTFFPIHTRDSTNLVSGADHIHTRRFGNPISFSVNVPAKNQPTINGETPAADRYEVSWDGWTAVVLWARMTGEVHAPGAAGQVVVEILQDALNAMGHSLLVQACSPSCEHLFGHRNMRVSSWAGRGMPFDIEFGIVEPSAPVWVKLQGDLNATSTVLAIHQEVALPAEAFARLKNTARRILLIQSNMRRQTSELLSRDYAALLRADVGFWRTIGHGFQDAWWFIRGEGPARPTKRLIAELWLGMAAVESLQQKYAEADRDFHDVISEWAIPELFTIDLKDDEARVESLNSDFARAAIENKSARMDNRGIVVATLVAAIFGSGIGAAIGGLLTAGGTSG
ncbi:hypothetical protein NY547_06750 [Cnuibacter physcomitrellae]|uniref:hypothetical protein n=1 Tax=Cnuibacter physcomitrellae TaxID=1619308 RepID=UPI002175CAE8|nr:hypothetical protein [Cnuibacter physcomitrellae]MCS5496933.1 hypothetical protein [Cnuibacter physcomitrellae]